MTEMTGAMTEGDWASVTHTLFMMRETDLALKLLAQLYREYKIPLPTVLALAYKEGYL